MNTNTFYTVIVFNIDIFETTIINERHFGSESEAQDFAKDNTEGHAVIVRIK